MDEIVDVIKFAFEDNLANPFTKNLVAKSFEKHVPIVGFGCVLASKVHYFQMFKAFSGWLTCASNDRRVIS